MNLDHVTAFTAAMQHKNLETMLSHMADDVVLNRPLIAEPIKGKMAIRQIVEPLLGVVNAFDFREIMHGPEHVSSFFKVTVERTQLDGMDYWLLDSAGLIKEMTVCGGLFPRPWLCGTDCSPARVIKTFDLVGG